MEDTAMPSGSINKTGNLIYPAMRLLIQIGGLDDHSPTISMRNFD